MLNKFLEGMKELEIKVVVEYCWVITQGGVGVMI
jgi:hypothetical protein